MLVHSLWIPSQRTRMEVSMRNRDQSPCPALTSPSSQMETLLRYQTNHSSLSNRLKQAKNNKSTNSLLNWKDTYIFKVLRRKLFHHSFIFTRLCFCTDQLRRNQRVKCWPPDSVCLWLASLVSVSSFCLNTEVWDRRNCSRDKHRFLHRRLLWLHVGENSA